VGGFVVGGGGGGGRLGGRSRRLMPHVSFRTSLHAYRNLALKESVLFLIDG
jgi:hypothetical protein